jgi:aspartyl protease family protein
MRRIVFAVILVALIAFLFSQFPYALSKTDDKMNLAYLVAILSICALSARKLPLNQTVRYSVIWLGVILAIIFAYSYKDALLNSRIMAELLPNRARVDAEGNLVIRASQDGHFHIEARVNGVPVNFMVDTGASDVVLSKNDARRIGLNPDTLSYSRTYLTANGATGGAPVKLNRLQIGQFTLDDFPASVNRGELDSSLLGMSALRRLGGFSIVGDEMIIGNQTRE